MVITDICPFLVSSRKGPKEADLRGATSKCAPLSIPRRIEKVEDVLNLGDMTWVKFMGFDEKGRANFSRKDALKEMAEQG